MGIGAALMPALNTYGKVQKVVGTIQSAQQVKNITDMKNQQGNPYDTRLGNPGIVPKKKTWEMPKYAESNESSLDTTKKKKKFTKRQKAGIAIGTTIGALALADILSKGDVFAPIQSVWSGAKTTPSAMFNKAERGDFGPGASVAASGLKKAVNRTKKDPSFRERVRSNNYGGENNKSSNNKQGKAGNSLNNFSTGFTMGAGILAAHMIGDKLLKNRQIKKSYDSKLLTNKDINRYHKTGHYPGEPVVEFGKNMYGSIKNDIDEIKVENQKSNKNQ